MSQKTYLWILKLGIYAAFIIVFFVFKNLLFPYITSKQISFNILIEALFILWLAFIIKYPEYKPKMSYITYGLAGFFLTLVISSIFGVDFNLSFWGDIERMLGVFHILHFLAYYLIIISVFREWKDWKILFIISIVFALFMSFNSKGYGTIGNTAYMSGYIIFNIYFVLLLFFREKHLGWRWLYFIPLPFYVMAFRRASTTGAHVGLGVGIIFLLFLYAVLCKHKKLKIIMISAFLFFTLFITLLFVNKDSDWVRGNSYFRAVGEVDFQKNTFQTRLISWRAAAKDLPSHPILGTGHGNYAITFDKYFDPSFYDYTRSETYFDRAHNNVIDIASTSGLAGLFTYLFIFGVVGFYLIQGYRQKKINIHEFVLLSSLIVAYFVQNLAVFDSFVTYLSLMIVLGYVYWLYQSDEEWVVPRDKELDNKEIFTLAGISLIIIVIMYQFNIKPFQMLVGTINGQRAWAGGQVEATYDLYQEALGHNTILDRDSRTSLNRLFSGGFSKLSKLDPAKAEEIIKFNIAIAEANVAYNEHDSLNQMMLAQLLNAAASFYANNQEKFEHYSSRALEAIDMSIAASPGRVPIYFQKAQIYITRGEQEKALETLKYAVELNPAYYDSSCHLAKTLFFFKQEEEGYQYMDQCLDMGGSSMLSPADFVKNMINHYVELEDMDRIILLYEQLTQLEKKNAEHWVNLARLYYDQGETDKAREAATKAGELDPSIKQYVDEFLSEISK